MVVSKPKQVSSVDVVFISPDSSQAVYQSLSGKLSAIEPPTWALLLATVY